MAPLTAEELKDKIQASAKYCRREETRKKIDLFLKAIQLGNILKACREFNKATSFYYYWWNRYRDSGFLLEALEEKSRRPNAHPRQIDRQVVEWIKRYREEFHYGPEKIRLYLEKDHNIRVSKATVYRVLLREKIPLRKRKDPSFPQRASLPASPSWDPETLVQKITGDMNELMIETRGQAPRAEIQSRIQAAFGVLRGKKIRSRAPLRELVAGRYLLEKELGRGGAGVVYLAQDLKSRKGKVALKRILLEKGQDPSLISAVKNEFAALSALHHPHLAEVFDFGMTEREIYFTSEWIEGQNLLQTTGQADLNTTFQLVVQILRALDFLHRRGVLHLDLKPENILVTDPDKTGDLIVKLIDFGTSEWRKKGQTTPGEFVGTPPYAPPEILREQSPGPASDIYSLGMLLHQVFARRFPFESQEPFEMMKEQILGEPLRIRELPPALPQDFADLLRKMVARDPRERFQSPQEVLSAINRSLGENFTLRSPSAPLHTLEESDFLFRRELLETLARSFAEGTPQVTVLSGVQGIGKSRLIRQIKWALQFRGISPLWWEEAEGLRNFLSEGAPPSPYPVLIDLHDESPFDFAKLLGQLENLMRPVLITTRRSASLEFNPTHWIDLKPLDSRELLDFLKNEISDFPNEAEAQAWADFCEGIPSRFEILLEAMCEAGSIQWTDLGWRWREGEKLEPSSLLSRHEARWRDRRERTLEILKFAKVGMSAKTLGGILNLDPQGLEEKLNEWEKEGMLTRKRTKKVASYSVKVPVRAEGLAPSLPDWHWLEKELEALYEKGEFSAGTGWADLLDSRGAASKEIPVKILLLCARHYAAAGEAEKALRVLPRSSLGPESGALCNEIRGRAFLIQGNLEEANREITQAEIAYRLLQDHAGLSRSFNLLGSMHKNRGDFGEAERLFSGAAQEASEVHADYLQGLAQMNLGTLYHDQGRFDRAQELYRKTFDLEKKASHPLLACKLRHNWVNLLFQTGRAQEAEGLCYEWLRLSLKHRYADQQAAALNYLALLAGQKNHEEMQLHFLNQALALLNPRLFPQLRFQTLINRGHLHWDLRQFTAAQLDGEAAFHLSERSLARASSSPVYLLLGKILRDRPRPDLEAATRYLNIGHQIIWENQIRQLKWEVEFERGLLAKKKKEGERARNYFLSAKKELESLLGELPQAFRQGYLRDRKLERISREMEPFQGK